MRAIRMRTVRQMLALFDESESKSEYGTRPKYPRFTPIDRIIANRSFSNIVYCQLMSSTILGKVKKKKQIVSRARNIRYTFGPHFLRFCLNTQNYYLLFH